MATHIVRGRYCLTADRSKVVPEGDPDGATLYATPGSEVEADEAERLGLVALDAKLAAPATKAVEAAPENKDAAPPKGKG